MNTTTRRKLQLPDWFGFAAIIATFMLMCAGLVIYNSRNYEQHLRACMQTQSEDICRSYLG